MSVFTRSNASRRPIHTLVASIAVGAVSCVTLAACSSSGSAGKTDDSPKTPIAALTAGVGKLAGAKSLSVELSAKPDAVLLTEIEAPEHGDPIFDPANKAMEGGLDIKVTVSADKALKSLTPSDIPNIDIDVKAAGTEYLDVRSVKGALYLKLDAADTISVAGHRANRYLKGLQSPRVPASLQPAIQSLMAGKWVGVSATDLKSLVQLGENFGGGRLGGQNATSLESQISKIAQAALEAVQDDPSAIVFDDQGNGQIDVTVSENKLGQALQKAIDPLWASMYGTDSGVTTPRAINWLLGSDGQIKFGTKLAGGALSELQIDALQFVPAGSVSGRLPIDLKLSSKAPAVTAPSGVTIVNVMAALGALHSN